MHDGDLGGHRVKRLDGEQLGFTSLLDGRYQAELVSRSPDQCSDQEPNEHLQMQVNRDLSSSKRSSSTSAAQLLNTLWKFSMDRAKRRAKLAPRHGRTGASGSRASRGVLVHVVLVKMRDEAVPAG